ncbi:MAG: MOSC domain-containing protein [Leptolyngbyaceae cyanobacterium]
MSVVVSVNKSSDHTFSKQPVPKIMLLAGLGVEGDAHCGERVKHRSRVKKAPMQVNLRQVHLIHLELIAELQAAGFSVAAAAMGENITTQGVDLLALPRGTRLKLGASALIEVTGLRNPCKQLNDFQPGLMAAVLDQDNMGNVIRKSGIMSVVITGGEVSPGDAIEILLPPPPHEKLAPV